VNLLRKLRPSRSAKMIRFYDDGAVTIHGYSRRAALRIMRAVMAGHRNRSAS
jgi:hypothetical protein